MHKTINILRDVVLEARTASKNLEDDDPLSTSLEFIENMTNIAIENLNTHIGGIDAA